MKVRTSTVSITRYSRMGFDNWLKKDFGYFDVDCVYGHLDSVEWNGLE